MKNTFYIVWALLIFSLSACNQNGFTNKDEAKNYTDGNGLKQGKWCEYLDENLSITTQDKAKYYALRIYKDGKKNGIVRAYLENGKLYQEVHYTDGKKNGIVKTYYESGKLQWETPYANDTIKGILNLYYENGKLQRAAPFFDGKLNGIEKEYYESGKLLRITSFFDGQKNGIEKEYDDSGKLWEETPYTSDTVWGILNLYYQNGKLQQEVPYAEGKKNGIEKDYYESGKLAWEKPFIKGIINGIEKEYDESGKFTKITPYIDGKENWTVFIKNIFCNGRWVGGSGGLSGGIETTIFYSDGSLNTEDPNSNGDDVKGTWSSDTIPNDNGTRVGIKVDLHNGEPVYFWNLYMFNIYTNQENVYIVAGFGGTQLWHLQHYN